MEKLTHFLSVDVLSLTKKHEDSNFVNTEEHNETISTT